jgi:hypothetical protein
MSKLESLSEQQVQAIPKYRDKWMEIATASVPPEFYDDFICNRVKDAIVGMYAAAKKTISKDNIIFSDSPVMALFMASARTYGKAGTPKKPVKWAGKTDKIKGMEAVENYLNTFSNPRDIIKNSHKFKESIYWGMSDAGFCGFVEFFQKETNIPVDYSGMTHINAITEFTHFILVLEDFCVVAKRPTFFIHKDGKAPENGLPYIGWADGISLVK